MNRHSSSSDDVTFREAFEACSFPPQEFGHRAHVRLAYVYLVEDDVETAVERMREALFRFLDHHGVDRAKYHETMTRAWIMAVRHFMERDAGASSADAFIDANPRLLDSKIMLTHYSAELLFSPQARAGFVEPDKDPIPRYQD
jgi:hypothetical protein